MSFFLASCVGLTFLLKYAQIIKHYRQQLVDQDEFFRDMFKCSLCLGFWSGMLHIPVVTLCTGFEFRLLLLPLVSAGISWFADSVLQTIQILEVYVKRLINKD